MLVSRIKYVTPPRPFGPLPSRGDVPYVLAYITLGVQHMRVIAAVIERDGVNLLVKS